MKQQKIYPKRNFPSGLYLMTRPMCSDCQVIKERIQREKPKIPVEVMDITTMDATVIAGYCETLELTVPHLIELLPSGKYAVFDGIDEISEFLWGDVVGS